MTKGRWMGAAVLLLLCVVMSAPAFGQAKTDTWLLGAQYHYVSITPFISPMYDEYKSVTANAFGIQGGYSWEIIDVVGKLENYTINIPDGTFVKDKDKPIDNTDIHADGFGMVAIEAMARFKIPAHEMVQPIFGLGVGLGFGTGKLETRDWEEVNDKARPEAEWNDSTPGVVPVFEANAGLRIIPVENFTIDIDAGLYEGLGFGLNLCYYH